MSTDSMVKDKIEDKVKVPKKYKVILHNDNYTPFPFVEYVLESIFNKTGNEASNITNAIHHKGIGIVGVYTKEIASQKVNKTISLAKANKYPLKATMQDE